MFADPEQIVEYMRDLFEEKKGELGLKYISIGDERLLPEYPALQITAGNFEREIVGTHKFGLVFNIEMWLYHANMNVDYRERTMEDMALATGVKNLLDDYANLPTPATPGGEIIFGFVDSATPGVMNRAVGGKSTNVITTRITWRGESRQTF